MKRMLMATALWLCATLCLAGWETADRVKETTVTTGTGTVTLLGVAGNNQTFVSGIGDTNSCYYCIAHQSVVEWEVGLGTVADNGASDDTLARTTVLASSTGSAINFSAGTKDVFCVLASARTLQQDSGGRVEIPDILSADNFYISHDGSSNLFETTSGPFEFTGDSSIGNADIYLNVKGAGTGRGFIRLYDQDEAEYLWAYVSNGSGFIETKGVSPSNLHLQYGADDNVRFFNGASSGENPLVTLYGWDSGAGAVKNFNMQVGANGTSIFSTAVGEDVAFRPNASSSEGLVCEAGGNTHILGTIEVDEEAVFVDRTTSPTITAGDVGIANVGGDFEITTDADKTLVLKDTVWDDQRVSLISARVPGSKAPGWLQFKDNGAGSTGVFLYWFDDSTEEELYFSMQLSHRAKIGTDIEPHIHWVPEVNGTAGETVSWGLEYTWQDIGGTFGNSTIIYTNTHSPADSSLVAGKHYLSDFATISGANTEVSSVLVGRIFRDAPGNGLTDSYGDDAGGLYVDFHFEVDTMGSRTELSK